MRRNQPLFVQGADLHKNTFRMSEVAEQGKVRIICESCYLYSHFNRNFLSLS